MKNIKNLFIGGFIILLTSCASTIKFPVSNVTPAAEITAKMKKEKNNNFVIEVTAMYMASPDRLNPPHKVYVVWIETENNGTKNLGQLSNKNAKKTFLRSSTPFNLKEIFITAEEQGNISYPEGIEISRTSF